MHLLVSLMALCLIISLQAQAANDQICSEKFNQSSFLSEPRNNNIPGCKQQTVDETKAELDALAARLNVSNYANENPDTFAHLLKVSRDVGLPVETVLGMPDDAQRQQKTQSIHWETLAKVAPATAKMLATPTGSKSESGDNVTEPLVIIFYTVISLFGCYALVMLWHQISEYRLFQNLSTDTLVFVAIPFWIVSASIDSGLEKAIQTSLLISDLSYVGAFLFCGGYAACIFKQRLSIMIPVFLLSLLYWSVLWTTKIADGYGDGNVLAFLFCLTMTGTLAYKKVQLLMNQKANK